MKNEEKLITEYVTIASFPETKEVSTKEGTDVYRFDVLKGRKIPNNPGVSRNAIKQVEFKFSPNSNIPGVKKSAIEVTRMIAERFDKLKAGELYAKVSVFMSPRANKNGTIDTYVPYINDVEFVEVDDVTRPYVQAAIESTTQLNF